MAMKKRGLSARLEKEFFAEVSRYGNYIGEETVQAVYYAILRAILMQLQLKKDVHLPNFGTFYTHTQRAKRMMDVRTGEMRNIEPKVTLKFTPIDRLKKYLHKKMSS